MTIFVYEDAKWEETLMNATSPYALTGAVFSQDRYAIEVATVKHKMLPVTSISMTNQQVLSGQQPFGGARASGTNDKAGSPLNLLRWASPRTIKETL
jgi:1-pyrroline-5-carboxylate dehydrogenase